MLIGHIRNANCILKGPSSMENCSDLPVVKKDGMMVSAWMPTPAELKLLNDGQPVYLFVWGERHPPVALAVPEE